MISRTYCRALFAIFALAFALLHVLPAPRVSPPPPAASASPTHGTARAPAPAPGLPPTRAALAEAAPGLPPTRAALAEAAPGLPPTRAVLDVEPRHRARAEAPLLHATSEAQK